MYNLEQKSCKSDDQQDDPGLDDKVLGHGSDDQDDHGEHCADYHGAGDIELMEVEYQCSSRTQGLQTLFHNNTNTANLIDD